MTNPQGMLYQGDVVRLRHLLQLAHDKMDDMNAGYEQTHLDCFWCSSPGSYDGQGLRHADDCVLVLIRKELNG